MKLVRFRAQINCQELDITHCEQACLCLCSHRKGEGINRLTL